MTIHLEKKELAAICGGAAATLLFSAKRRRDVARLLAKRETATASQKARIERTLAYAIMKGKPLARSAGFLTNLLAGLATVNALYGTVRGAHWEAPDASVYPAAARCAGIDQSEALTLDTDVRAHMRSLTD